MGITGAGETSPEGRRKNAPPEGLMKALIRSGYGESMPEDGDQVIFHSTVRTLDGFTVQSTKSQFGGNGIPNRLVLGKSSMILGFLLGIPTMCKGEVSIFKLKPEFHYGESDCPLSMPDSFPGDDELHFEVEMVDFHKVKVVSEDLGVLKMVVNEGDGWETPREPYEVRVLISARGGDGNLLFSSNSDPFFFTFGRSEVPLGLEMGIGTMAKGEKAMIYVNSQYLTESTFVSANGVSEVHFEVELVHFVQVRDVLGDGRLIKRRIRDGRGEFPMDCPLQDSLITVHYKGMLLDDEKTLFYDTRIHNRGLPLEFWSGEGLVPEGFEMCVRLMLRGETSLVTCPPDYAYDRFKRPENVPPGSDVQWEIELLDFRMQVEWTGMTFRGIMEEAEKARQRGNRLFKEGKFVLAKGKYEKVLRDYNHVLPKDDEEGKEFAESRSLFYLNVAACELKMGECGRSIEACNRVLEVNPANVKALYRRGMAYMEKGDFVEAKADFEMMCKVDESLLSASETAIRKLKQRRSEAEKRARRQFRGLFDKKPGEISEVEGGISESVGEEGGEGDDGGIQSVEEMFIHCKHPWLWPAGIRFLRTLGIRFFRGL